MANTKFRQSSSSEVRKGVGETPEWTLQKGAQEARQTQNPSVQRDLGQEEPVAAVGFSCAVIASWGNPAGERHKENSGVCDRDLSLD